MADYERVLDAFQRAMFEQHDAEAVAKVYAEDATYVDPLTGEVKGRQAIKEVYETLLKAFPDTNGEVLSQFGSEDRVASELKVRGTHTGPLELEPGNIIPATGKSFELSICWLGRITSDGLIAEDHTYYDTSAWLRQLGLMEQLGTAAAA